MLGSRSRPTASDRFAAMQGYWIYETSDSKHTSEKTIDNLLIENFAASFQKSNIADQHTRKLGYVRCVARSDSAEFQEK